MATANKLSEPGQFDIEIVNIITSEGVVIDLTESTIEINFFESIEANSLTGLCSATRQCGCDKYRSSYWSGIFTNLD